MADDVPDPDLAPDPAPGHYRKQVLRNTAAAGLSNVWAIVVMVVSVPLLLRGLGKEAFGTWVLLQTFSALTGWLSLADLGLGVATTRAVADRMAKDDRTGLGTTVGSSLATALTLGAVAGLLLATVGRAVLPTLFQVPDDLVADLQFALVVFGAQVVFELVGVVMGCCFDGLQRVDASRGLESLRRTAVMAVCIPVALNDGGLRGVTVAGAVATAVVTLIAAILLARQVPISVLHPSIARSRQLMHYGRRVWILNGTGVLHRTVDRTVVGAILGPGAVTLVEIATQVQNGVAALLSATSYAATTTAAWVQARANPERLHELLLRGTKYTCLVTLPLCGVVAVLAGPLVDVWVGEEYAAAAGLVALALAYLATQAPLATGSNLLVGIGKAGAIFVPAFLAVVVNAGLSIVLVNTNGIAGAFVATICSSFVLMPLLARAVTSATGISAARVVREAVVPTLWPALAASAAALGVRALGLGSWATLLLGGGAAAIVGLGVAATVGLGPAERAELRGLLRRERSDRGDPAEPPTTEAG